MVAKTKVRRKVVRRKKNPTIKKVYSKAVENYGKYVKGAIKGTRRRNPVKRKTPIRRSNPLPINYYVCAIFRNKKAYWTGGMFDTDKISAKPYKDLNEAMKTMRQLEGKVRRGAVLTVESSKK